MSQTKMTDFYKYKPKHRVLNKIIDKNKKVYGYNRKTDSWHCIQCGIDMGQEHPRQLCRKYYCENEM